MKTFQFTGTKTMDHSEAVQEMATERYLLDELTPEMREAFEQHVFDCRECALDLRATAAFVEEAKAQLLELTADAAALPAAVKPEAVIRKRDWLSWWRPLFANPLIAGPVFATLLVIVGYQNLVMYPALRSAASEPRFVQFATLHSATRGGEPLIVHAGGQRDLGLFVGLPQEQVYPSYAFELYDAQGKRAWSQQIAASAASGVEDGQVPLVIPGAGLRQGTYSLVVYGVAENGQLVHGDRYGLDIRFNE